jgi:glutamate N-acetyltransferase / amino-acid N-acetyltransferase
VSVTYPRGFRAAGTAAGLKESGRPDLGVLVVDETAAAAGAFTTNAFPAAPVSLTKAHLSTGRARAVVVNSGQANAGTGDAGLDDANEIVEAAAAALGCNADDVLVCSTGVIGPRIAVGRVRSGLDAAAASLSEDGGAAFAEAILTTDLRPKLATAESDGFRVGGCAKGAGMIAPRLVPHGLATLLTFVTTDAAATPELLRRIVSERVVPVWNGVTVDGCQSTNDTVLVLASGAAEGPADEADLADAIEAVCRDLARQLTAEAEGATKTIVVQVDGAADDEAARRIGVAVAGSDLVKTAVFGGDPNPGRILQAAGDAGVAVHPRRFHASLGGAPVIQGGVVLEPPAAAKQALEGP